MASAGRWQVRPADQRPVTRSGGICSRHSFSFGVHYDPANTHHGQLLSHNDDTLEPGAGFDVHPHRDLEIVTWVLEGELVHADGRGRQSVLGAGMAQRLSAGRGTEHAEHAADGAHAADGGSSGAVRYLQMWLPPDGPGGDPAYASADFRTELDGGQWVAVASGDPEAGAALSLGTRQATLLVARLAPGQQAALPAARFVHAFVARGAVTIESGGDGAGDSALVPDGLQLGAGDALRLTDSDAWPLLATEPAEVVVWAMNSGLG